WKVGDSLPVIAVGSYFIWCGVRLNLWANQKWHRAKARVKWGPVCFGASILYSQIKRHFHPTPTPDALKPSNETQAQGMAAASIIIAFEEYALRFLESGSLQNEPQRGNEYHGRRPLQRRARVGQNQGAATREVRAACTPCKRFAIPTGVL
ncbi:MAG: hypothetical protein WA209_00690, partial [Candidatus Acidiferrales bacterium]